MNDLLKKLNVLVRSGLNDLVDSERPAQRRSTDASPSPAHVEREVHTLRQRVNDALDYEDELLTRVNTLRAEVDRLDSQADVAVAEAQDDAARRHVRDLQLAQRRLALAESDLQEHRAVTQELMLRVNELDAAAADLKRAQSDSEDTNEGLEQASQMMGDVLAQMRERIAGFTALQAETSDHDSQDDAEVDETAVDDDLARRVERLSKK